jgi:hypothetical protein
MLAVGQRRTLADGQREIKTVDALTGRAPCPDRCASWC